MQQQIARNTETANGIVTSFAPRFESLERGLAESLMSTRAPAIASQRREVPGGRNFPRPNLGHAAPGFSEVFSNLVSGSRPSVTFADARGDQSAPMPGYPPASASAASYDAPGMAGYSKPAAGGSHHYIGKPHTGGRRSLFDDKIAAAEHMRYSDGKKEEWFKTSTNDLKTQKLWLYNGFPI